MSCEWFPFDEVESVDGWVSTYGSVCINCGHDGGVHCYINRRKPEFKKGNGICRVSGDRQVYDCSCQEFLPRLEDVKGFVPEFVRFKQLVAKVVRDGFIQTTREE